MISLATGAGAAVLAAALAFGGVFEPLAVWLAERYESRGWAPAEEWLRWRWLEFVITFVAAIGMAGAVIEVTGMVRKVMVAVAAFAVLLVLSPLFALYGVLFEPSATLLGALVAGIGAFAFARTAAGKRKWLLEEAVGTRVSGKVFDALLESPVEPGFEGARRPVTTLVCCLFPPDPGEGAIEAPDLLTMGSLFLRTVSTFLLSRGAYLEEAGPERVRVSFGMLAETEDHAVLACRTALDLRIRLRGLSQEFESRWFHPLRCGVGVESGEMTVGLCGTPGRFFFAGMGGGEDFAGRLALANRRFGSDLLIGPAAQRQVGAGFEVRPVEMVYDPVRCELREVFQLLAESGQLSQEERGRRDQFWRGVILLREKKCEEALECFSKARVPGVDDGPLAYFTEQAQQRVTLPEGRSLRLVKEFTEEGHARLIDRF